MTITFTEFADQIGQAVKNIEKTTGKSVRHFRCEPLFRSPDSTLHRTMMAINVTFENENITPIRHVEQIWTGEG